MRKDALLTYEQMESLTTERLLAYKSRLYKVHEREHWACSTNNGIHVTKESPEWKKTLSDAKIILATREHISK